MPTSECIFFFFFCESESIIDKYNPLQIWQTDLSVKRNNTNYARTKYYSTHQYNQRIPQPIQHCFRLLFCILCETLCSLMSHSRSTFLTAEESFTNRFNSFILTISTISAITTSSFLLVLPNTLAFLSF